MKSILRAVNEDNKFKRELTGKASNICVIPTTTKYPHVLLRRKKKPGKKHRPEPLHFHLSPSAFSHLCKMLKVPVDYILQCPPTLKCANLSFWMEQLPEDERWVLKIKEKVIRAVMPHSGNLPFSNLEVANIFALLAMETKVDKVADKKVADKIAEASYDLPKFVVDWIYLNDETFHFRIMFPEMVLFHEDTKKKSGVFPALHVSHSEIGMHGFRMDLALYREASDSSIITMVAGKRFFRPRAAYKEPAALQADITKALQDFDKVTKGVAAKADKARAKKIKDFPAWLEKARIKYKFSKVIIPRALEVYATQEQNLWGACMAIAKAGKERFDGEKRYSMEAMAGLLLDTV